MSPHLKRVVCPALIAIELLTLPTDVRAAQVLAGFAVVDITPPVGYRMSGYFYERISTGVHNPLSAKVVVLKQEETCMAWVFCDLVGIPSKVSSRVRAQIEERTGIPQIDIVISATHTHTGPEYFGPLRNYYHKKAIETLGEDPHEAIDYPAQLVQELVDAVVEASNNLAAVEIAAGRAVVRDLAFNRRYVMRDGSVRTNPGLQNPDVVRPAGPIDPEVGMLQFRRGNSCAAGLTVFAMHLDTTGGTEFSADFPYFLGRKLQSDYGHDYLSVFALGTCGDINHIDLSRNEQQNGAAEAQRIGDTLGQTVLQGLENSQVIKAPSLAVARKVVNVPVQHYSEEEYATAWANLDRLNDRQLPMVEMVKTVSKVGLSELNLTSHLPMEIQAFRISDKVAIVTVPGELFVELGLKIKRSSPFSLTLVVELANDYPGYIPTQRGFAEGSYEPANSKIAPGGGELLVEVATSLLNELHQK